jgi:hypothetical protein
MIQDKIFFDEKDPTGVSYNTPFTVYGSYQGRLWSKTPTGSIKYYTQNSDLSVYATTGSNQFNGNQTVTGSLTVTGGITGSVTTASYVEYTGVANKPTLVSGSAQIVEYNVFATTGSNQFDGSQAITGSLTVTGQVVAQTLNVQQVTSSIVYSSGSNIFGNSLSNTQQFTGSVSVTGSLTSNGALTGTNATFTGTALLGGATATNPLSIRTANGESYIRFLNADGSSYGDLERSITGAGAVRFTGANFRFTAGAEVVGALTGSIATFSSTVAINGSTSVDSLTVSRNADNNSGGLTLFNANTSGYGSALTFRVNYAGVYNTSRIHGDWDTGNSGNLYFYTANTSQSLIERMRINGVGNVGIGTTNPVANDGTSRTLQLGNRLTIQNVIGTQFLLGTNVYYDGTWKYIAAAKAQAVRGTGESGGIQFSLSPTGTIGGTVTNMDGSDIKMIILDTGNVGIGTTSPVNGLSSSRTLNIYGGASTGGEIVIEGNSGGNFLSLNAGTSSGDLPIVLFNRGLRLGHATSKDATGFVESMRITSGGYLKVSPVGTYLNGSYNEINSNTNDQEILYNYHSGTSPYGVHVYFNSAPNNGTNYFQRWRDGSASRAYLYSNGGFANYQANDTNLSDERTKKDIAPLESYWDKFKAIEIVKFKYIDQTHDDYNIGVIAQQVEAVAPEFVDVDGWGETIEGEDPLKSIYTADLHHATIKVLQEAMAKIESLEALLQRNNIS